MKNEMTVFLDKNGIEITAGCVLYREFYIRKRERPGHRRVAINGMSGNESIVGDEGKLLNPEECWITRKVGWVGACLVAERLSYSDFQDLMQHAGFDENDKEVYEKSAVIDFNNCFVSENYTIIKGDK